MTEIELIVNQFILEQGKLYTLPELYQQLEEKIQSSNASIEEIGLLINTDAALSARILKLANSPLYGFRSEINTLQRALSLIGLQEVKNLILMDAVAGNINKNQSSEVLKMEDFWTRSVYIALLCKRITKRINHPNTDRLFISGIMSRIGQLVSCTTRREEVLKVVNETLSYPLMDEFKIEFDHLGFNYNQLSAELLNRWHVPEDITFPIRFLHSPLDLPDNLAPETIVDIYILHIATVYTHLLQHEDSLEQYSLEQQNSDVLDPDINAMTSNVNKYIEQVPEKINQTLAISADFIDDILFEIELDALEILNIVFPRSTTIY